MLNKIQFNRLSSLNIFFIYLVLWDKKRLTQLIYDKGCIRKIRMTKSEQ